MSSGGSRQGKPGAAYGNRTDLNTTKALPVTAVPGQPYGAAASQEAAQAAIPMQGGLPTPSAPAQVPQGPMPGDLPPLTGASQRPDEHVMTGVGTGAGAGPEAFTPLPPLNPALQGLSILNSLGSKLPPELRNLAQYLNVSQNNGTP